MRSLLLPYATTGVSRIAGWCWIGATPRGQPQTPARMLPHGARVCVCGGWRYGGRAAGPAWGAQGLANYCATRCWI